GCGGCEQATPSAGQGHRSVISCQLSVISCQPAPCTLHPVLCTLPWCASSRLVGL
ncbi:MAG: hypothetical protein, partial [Olavius algarvensis Gamma 1 endosymbiont]